ncbi:MULTISPECIES: ABC transporter substrate-binding protein [Methylomonas]|uniref:Solute-binding protein family 3/N-terminal domain-containing protein n=2 Tax=Methylomonas TaxID=416 RepID=A0A126T3S0_9GAMM|nr:MULTISPECIES: ABC transporter substrate-binding protein [Methylomonas]AMK76731.1 hypothetical protein JT25_009540 [Methylomonas denitrificans]OAI00027.1 hypothetical protein A1342_18545 [Methylomonas methanica]TCV82776.1 ABC-type nitrate/sulfonate/bicarbonate transport system substrate-binding protein [Methylomonas methanica]
MSFYTLRMLSALLLFTASFGATAQDAVKIRIGYPSGMNGVYPVVMEMAGIAIKHGLDAEFQVFQNGPPMMEALAAGQLDAVVSSPLPIATFLDKQPNKAVVVGQLGYSSHSLLLPAASNAKTFQDLKGKKIAASFGSDSYADLLLALRQNGLKPDEVELINTPPAELPGLVAQGQVDAAVIREPQATRVKEQFGARSIQRWPFPFLTVLHSEFLQKQPNARERYLAALWESVVYTAQNPEQASLWFAEKLRIDAKFVRQTSNEDPAFIKAEQANAELLALTPELRQFYQARWRQFHELGLIKQAQDFPGQ